MACVSMGERESVRVMDESLKSIVWWTVVVSVGVGAMITLGWLI